ncbi:sulfurtransferase TusA [Hahella sp. CCB-MM4]|uniref:sulfurtransferase TusA n=1 Tax=Hahella sp. (strain CCB-MM4) TaxID=1926491 RepID=UPI000BCBC180|nr:sulfurtransferase TusA [Hahella sp. CCB-MM4]OZG74082.1 sulfurtransferase TusA [Hahella sp. CCB-MM4]
MNNAQEYTIEETLDAEGLLCPEPVMMLHNKIRDISEGQVLEVIATDPSTQRDIPKFCEFLGHELLLSEERGNYYHYHIRKCEG